MRVLSERALEEILSVNVAIEAAEEAFRANSLGIANIPLRSEIHRKNPPGSALIMPGLSGNNGALARPSKQNRILQFAPIQLIWNGCFWRVLHPSHCYLCDKI